MARMARIEESAAAPGVPALESTALESTALESAALGSAALGSTALESTALGSGDDAEGGVGDFLCLLKPRVMSLSVFTASVGLWLAPHQPHPLLSLVAILCIAIGAGAAGAINMWFDRDIDALMDRTRHRPLPAGRLAASQALGFGVFLSVLAVTVMGLALNYLAAGLLALTIGFYIFIYTMWLKRRTPQNIVIGGAAGAFPPLVGWAAASGEIGLYPFLMSILIFFWTPPHFWALALYRNTDYAKAGVPMLPVTAGGRKTRYQIVNYSFLLALSALLPWAFNVAGVIYGISAALLSLVFIHHALAVWESGSSDHHSAERGLFGYSIVYLFLLFVAMLADRIIL